ncbi:MAG: PBP1A family penicillin-binding protein [Alphaproteobacteria bacterium]|nr:PBP1A family penicillin-binding protein [Alphaproteobacteria bacterium]
MAEPQLRVDPADRVRRPRRSRAPRRRAPAKSAAARAGKVGILLFLWIVIVGTLVLGYFALTLPDTAELTRAARRPSVTILAADGSVLTTYGDLFGQALSLKEMSPYLPKAVIATEDRRFYSHFGVDPIGLVRALFADIAAGHIVQGGSTITQQLAKILFLTPERSLSRKIQETMLALWLEHHFTKNQILEIYLNRVYLGAGAYGVDAAAHRYFNKSARLTNLYESAVIAGLLKAPTRFNPTRDHDKSATRAAQVLAKMVQAGFVTAKQAQAAIKKGASLPTVARERPGTRYFTDWIAEQLGDFADTGNRDLRVVTTLDPRMQIAAEAAVTGVIAREGSRMTVKQGALVAMSPDGAVRAMVGGRDYGQSQFNRVTQAQRQPGSAFKPFVYLAGLEAGIRPYDQFLDAPIRVNGWEPRDYTGRYQGEMSFAEGLAQSINTIAVQVAQRAGVGNVVAVAHRLGISSDLDPEISLALGTAEVNLMELVSAYAPFANGGVGVLPYGIAEIRDGTGKIVFRRVGSGLGQVVSPELAGTMNEMLSAAIAHGTGRNAALPRPAAGKTGTTQDYRDAWFVGYTADLVAGVWLGNDDNTPMKKVSGGSLPAQAWRRFMLAATKAMPVRALPSARRPPPSIVAEAPPRSGGGFFENFFRWFRPGPPPAPPRFPGSY